MGGNDHFWLVRTKESGCSPRRTRRCEGGVLMYVDRAESVVQRRDAPESVGRMLVK